MARMRSADRREQLLKTAIGVFAKAGYRAATTAALAQAAGITEPILYRHFKNKQDLFAALVQAVGGSVLTAWRNELGKAASPKARWHAILQSNPATHEAGEEAYRVIFSAMLEGRQERSVAKALAAHLEELHAFLRDEVTSLQRAGVVSDEHRADAIAWVLVDVAIGHGMRSGVMSKSTAELLAERKRLRDTLETSFSLRRARATRRTVRR